MPSPDHKLSSSESILFFSSYEFVLFCKLSFVSCLSLSILNISHDHLIFHNCHFEFLYCKSKYLLIWSYQGIKLWKAKGDSQLTRPQTISHSPESQGLWPTVPPSTHFLSICRYRWTYICIYSYYTKEVFWNTYPYLLHRRHYLMLLNTELSHFHLQLHGIPLYRHAIIYPTILQS